MHRTVVHCDKEHDTFARLRRNTKRVLDTHPTNDGRGRTAVRTVANILDSRTNCRRRGRSTGGMRGDGILHLLGVEKSIRGSNIRPYAWQASEHKRSCLENHKDGEQQGEGPRSQMEEVVQHTTPMARDEEEDVSTPLSGEHTDSIRSRGRVYN